VHQEWGVQGVAENLDFCQVSSEQGFKIFTQPPLAGLQEVSFGGCEENSSIIGVSGFNCAAPFILQEYSMDSHAAIGFLRICHMYVKVKVGVSNFSQQNSCKVVEVFVVVVD